MMSTTKIYSLLSTTKKVGIWPKANSLDFDNVDCCDLCYSLSITSLKAVYNKRPDVHIYFK